MPVQQKTAIDEWLEMMSKGLFHSVPSDKPVEVVEAAKAPPHEELKSLGFAVVVDAETDDPVMFGNPWKTLIEAELSAIAIQSQTSKNVEVCEVILKRGV